MSESIYLFKKNWLLVLFFSVILFMSGQERLYAQTSPGLSFNYSQIKEHPRLLLGKGEQTVLRKAIRDNKPYQILDEHLKEVADGFLEKPPVIFKKDGKRLLAVSREALTRIYYLSYGYRMTGEKKYLDRAEKELIAVCSFNSWNPTHFLDVGEMCMAVAIGYDWLYKDLKSSTRALVRKAIVEKAFAPSYNKKDAWFLTFDNNWNSVCNAGLVFGALAIMDEEKDKSIAIIERAMKTNHLPLSAYAPDGNYPEGPGYWNYGTSFEVMLCAALQSALGSDGGLSAAPGFLKSPYYMLYAVGPSGYYFNYSDCGKAASASPSMFWFARKLKDPSLVYREVALINKGIYTKVRDMESERLLPNVLILGKGMDLSEQRVPTGHFFSGAGHTPIAIARTSWVPGKGLYMGIKGGQASSSHGHMDQGSFVFDKGGLRWAMDLGLQSYITLESKGVDLWNMTQNSQRWDVFRYNNLNHNTLTINHQRHNVNGRAEIIRTTDNAQAMGAKVDLTAVLNLHHELKKATREATIVDNAYLKVEDILETNNKPVDLRWNMVTPAEAKIIGDHTIALTQKGKTIYLNFSCTVPFKLAIRPSAKPADYICDFGNYKYGAYNQENKGTVMVGLDATLTANHTAKVTAILSDSME